MLFHVTQYEHSAQTWSSSCSPPRWRRRGLGGELRRNSPSQLSCFFALLVFMLCVARVLMRGLADARTALTIFLAVAIAIASIALRRCWPAAVSEAKRCFRRRKFCPSWPQDHRADPRKHEVHCMCGTPRWKQTPFLGLACFFSGSGLTTECNRHIYVCARWWRWWCKGHRQK